MAFGIARLSTIVAAATLSLLSLGGATPVDDAKGAEKWKGVSFYTLKTKSIDGKDVDLKDYNGKVSLVVNVASKCGLTPQYAGLEKLYGDLKDKGFVILGFPCNDFGNQEPGTAEEIKTFCSSKYNVTFPMFAKAQSKAGEGQSEIYNYLGARTNSLPSWNFGKYLIGRDGQPIAFFESKVKPDDKDLRAAIEKALAAPAPK
jgi:glutathione peroxidase